MPLFAIPIMTCPAVYCLILPRARPRLPQYRWFPALPAFALGTVLITRRGPFTRPGEWVLGRLRTARLIILISFSKIYPQRLQAEVCPRARPPGPPRRRARGGSPRITVFRAGMAAPAPRFLRGNEGSGRKVSRAAEAKRLACDRGAVLSAWRGRFCRLRKTRFIIHVSSSKRTPWKTFPRRPYQLQARAGRHLFFHGCYPIIF